MNRWVEIFHFSALLLLAITAACKLVSVVGEAKVLAMADPVFRILSIRQIMMVAAMMEIGVAWYLWKGTHTKNKSFLLLWLSGVFIAYRFGLWLMQYKGCSCLGTVTQWLPVSPATVDVLMKVVLAYLTVGSAIFFSKSSIFGKDRGERQAS